MIVRVMIERERERETLRERWRVNGWLDERRRRCDAKKQTRIYLCSPVQYRSCAPKPQPSLMRLFALIWSWTSKNHHMDVS